MPNCIKFIFYTLISSVVVFPNLYVLTSDEYNDIAFSGFKDITLGDIVLFILFIPGTIFDLTIIFIIYIINIVQESRALYVIKKFLSKKVFK